jgi:hypothetical protein
MKAPAERAGFGVAGKISTSIKGLEATYPDDHVEWHEAKGEWTPLAAQNRALPPGQLHGWGVMRSGMLRHPVSGRYGVDVEP